MSAKYSWLFETSNRIGIFPLGYSPCYQGFGTLIIDKKLCIGPNHLQELGLPAAWPAAVQFADFLWWVIQCVKGLKMRAPMSTESFALATSPFALLAVPVFLARLPTLVEMVLDFQAPKVTIICCLPLAWC